MLLNGTGYRFDKNIFGDVVGIYNTSNALVGAYRYDAWGYCTIIQDTSGIATANPFRYRGYYWDSKLSLYYLESRFYDPTIRRFINADDISYLDPATIGGLNLFAYCNNNPVMLTDSTGHFPILITLILGGFALAGGIIKGIDEYSNGARGWGLVGQIALGSAAGLAVGGVIVMFAGIGAALFGSAGLATSVLGVTASQAFGIGAVTINIVAWGIMPLFNIHMQGIDYGAPTYPNLPKKPQPTPKHPAGLLREVPWIFSFLMNHNII